MKPYLTDEEKRRLIQAGSMEYPVPEPLPVAAGRGKMPPRGPRPTTTARVNGILDTIEKELRISLELAQATPNEKTETRVSCYQDAINVVRAKRL
ncbi:MAG: hypothetical protein JSR30_00145 [Proteobacteria bacterium]|nr:hypothetical protein [Pseudomonadota bacterium]